MCVWTSSFELCDSLGKWVLWERYWKWSCHATARNCHVFLPSIQLVAYHFAGNVSFVISLISGAREVLNNCMCSKKQAVVKLCCKDRGIPEKIQDGKMCVHSLRSQQCDFKGYLVRPCWFVICKWYHWTEEGKSLFILFSICIFSEPNNSVLSGQIELSEPTAEFG